MKTSKRTSFDSLEDSLKSTGATLFQKAAGRDTKPAWGNRIVKDFYDLDYDLPGNLASITEKFTKQPAKLKTRVSSGVSKGSKRSSNSGLGNYSEVISSRKTGVEAAYMEMYKRNPEKIEIGAVGNKGETLGLCPYQYQNTIQGRIANRANHHLSFDKNRVNRIVNENPIYYDRHQDIDLSHSRHVQKKKAIDTHHPFESYTNRRTFEPRDELDKIFDTESGLQLASPTRSPQAIRKFDTVVERKEPRLNESVGLSYEHAPAIAKLKRKSISYSITNQERETEFSPQVISERRGCYR